MKEVTDPNILAQFGETQDNNMREVTDPNVLAQFEGQQQSQFPERHGNFFTGLGTGLANQVSSTGEQLLFGLPFGGTLATTLNQLGLLPKVPRVKEEENPTMGYKVGKFAGEYGPMIYGGAQVLRKGIPMLGRYIASKAKINPAALSDGLISDIMSNKGIEESGKALALQVRNKGLGAIETSASHYKPIMDEIGGISIYKRYPKQKGAEITKILPLDAEYFEKYPGQLRSIRKDFIGHPTFENAHNFQSQLGSAIRSLGKKQAKGALTPYEAKQLNGFNEIRDLVKQHQIDYLKREAPHLIEPYSKASEWHLDNVVPYLENPKISAIVREKVTNPRNVQNIFRNPEPGMEKIINDIGPEGKKNIFAAEFGKLRGNKNPQKVVDLFEKLEEKGLGSYVTPEMENKLSGVLKAMGRKKELKKIGIGAGIGLGTVGGVPSLKHLITRLIP